MKYIIFTGTITRVGGAQIYVKNKVNYMKSLGWDVYVFSALDGPVIINGLSEFKNAIIPELNYYPNYFSNKDYAISNPIRSSSQNFGHEILRHY